jgi:hypothetical protein
MRRRTLTIAILCGLFIAATAGAGVILVPDHYKEIHAAVQACGWGDTVMVAAGVYHDCSHETEGPGSVPACVIMKSGVTLRGAGPDATIIDAQASEGKDGRGIFVEAVSDCRIENLQVTGAYAEVYGAGILIRQVDGSVTVTDVKISGNDDGGIICINSAGPTLTRVDFLQNLAKQGGGLSIEENSHPSVTDCLFDDNSAPTGAGIMIRVNSNPEISGCTVQNNSINQAGDGAGIAIINSSPDIHDCDVVGNTTQGNGGGIHMINAGGQITACLISGNSVTGGYSLGGGIYANASSVVLNDLLITNNSASGYFGEGGGFYAIFAPSPTLQNCTLDGNGCGAAGTGGGVTCDLNSVPSIDKCIISNSIAGQGLACLATGTPTVSCTDIYGNTGGDKICGKDMGGNFSAIPRYCATMGVEYHLGENSPCAPGNHPDGPTACGGQRLGARPVGCGFVGVLQPPPVFCRLLGNVPNPFNPRTRIFFVIASSGPATLRLYDARGSLVRTFSWDGLAAGPHEVTWDGADARGRTAPSGVYFGQLEAGGHKATQRMALIR